MNRSDSVSDSLRVLMTADAVGGVWRYALDLSRALIPHDVSVTLAVMGPKPTPAQSREAAAVPNVTLRSAPFRLEWMPDSWRDVVSAGEWLVGLASSAGADIIHLNGYAHATLPWNRPVVVTAHSCVATWWRAVHGTTPDSSWDRYTAAVAAALRTADIVVSPTAAMAQALTSHYGGGWRSAVIPNGTVSRASGHVRKEPFVLGAGRLWDQAKNSAALASVARRCPWPVLLAGPVGVPTDGVASERSPEDGACRYLGTLAPRVLRTWMERASIFAHPARYEPFGLAVLEAADAACALVLGRIASLQELWAGAAIFVDPLDQEELARAIEQLINDPARRAMLGHSARRQARRYALPVTAARYAALYRALSAGHDTTTEHPTGELVPCAS